jgi:hypothetical protein
MGYRSKDTIMKYLVRLNHPHVDGTIEEEVEANSPSDAKDEFFFLMYEHDYVEAVEQ